MPRKLTTREARKMAAARTNRRGGRPRIETPCRKCGALCPSARAAQAHC